MKITIDVKDGKGIIQTVDVRRGYLVKFINPEKIYPISYYINKDGDRIPVSKQAKGEDLSENQIAELFSKELL